MSTVLAISASPSEVSRSAAVAEHTLAGLADHGYTVQHLRLRELPAKPLLSADTKNREVAAAVAAVADADGIVLSTPTYKAAYSGLLKVFLDLLPQFAFAGKALLPMATGGSTAHVLALDYALRPVLHSLGAWHVLGSVFVTDGQLDGDLAPDEGLRATLTGVLADFHHALTVPARRATIVRSA